MSLPQFFSQKVSDNSSTTVSGVVKVINNTIDNLNSIFTYLLKKVQLDSVVLKDIKLVVGDNIIPHTLGRTYTGYNIVRRGAVIKYYDSISSQYDPNVYLVINVDVSTTVNIEVY